MRTARSVLYGGPGDGKEVHPPTYANSHTEGGEIYFRSEIRDSDNRQVFKLKLGRCAYRAPKQNHFPE